MAIISLFGSLEFALYFFVEDVDFSVQLPPSRDNYISKYKISNACGNKDVFHEMKKESFCVHYMLLLVINMDMISRLEQCIPLPFYAG